MRKRKRFAAIDVGTNSTRLLVADCRTRGTTTIERDMVITRLGAGVDSGGMLMSEGMTRTVEAVDDFYRRAVDMAPRAVRIAATSALRDSANGEVFLQRILDTTGIEPEVLTGRQEAELSYLGAVSELDLGRSPEAVFVFDIGGGSTELMVGFHHIERVWSIDVGCVRMSERFLAGDPPSPVELSRMEAYLVAELNEPLKSVRETGFTETVGLAGTVTTVSAIIQGLPSYDSDRIHHSRVTRERVEGIYRTLASVPLEERKAVMGLEPGRADVIIGGIAVLRTVMDLARVKDILVSEKDILDGLVLDLYESDR